MADLRRLLDKLLGFQMSECVYIQDEGKCEPYLTSLRLETTSALYVCPYADNFSMKFVDFDVWLANGYILFSGAQVEFQTSSVLLVLLIKLENEIRLVFKDEVTGAHQELSVEGSHAAFYIEFLGYGLVFDSWSYKRFGLADFGFLGRCAPYEAGVVLLNHCFRQRQFYNAALVLRYFDYDCLQQFVYYTTLTLCKNFGLFYVAVCIRCGAVLLSDFDYLLANVDYSAADAACLQRLDTDSNYAISSVLNSAGLLGFFPQSPVAQNNYVQLCEDEACDYRLLSAPYYELIRSIGAESDCLNPVFRRYFTCKDDLYLAGAVILLCENEAFARQHLLSFVASCKEIGFPKHLAPYLACLFERHLDIFAGTGVLESAVFLLYRARDVRVSRELQEMYPFLKSYSDFRQEREQDSINELLKAPPCDPCPVCLEQIYQVATLGCSHKLCAQCLREVERCPICCGEIKSFTYQDTVFR